MPLHTMGKVAVALGLCQGTPAATAVRVQTHDRERGNVKSVPSVSSFSACACVSRINAGVRPGGHRAEDS